MMYALRIKENPKHGEWSGMYMTETRQSGMAMFDIKVKKFNSYDEAQNFLNGLYKNENWEIVEFIEE